MKLWAYSAVAGVVIALIIGAWVTSSYRTNQKCALRVNQAVEKIRIEKRTLADQLTSAEMERRRLSRKYNDLLELAKDSIDDNPDCYYDGDAIVYVNQASGMSKSASLDAYTAAAPATRLSRQGAIDVITNRGNLYNDIAAQLSALQAYCK